ncbi:hypothetical protein CW745_06175 [Psychromonas sp. psych-6C06]|uniref:hypothetical protein n=1 Tax=Psychromonas sp. psych-6C06 TaxID=2058089 RepID=UPI000C3394DE|nr:hypothetical protein [Psychromonas sp. psych-6C06]PKF63010.1 hypothetical protein CW745_06175 [Psychromonas sp. psych-6C06]
MRDVDLYNMQTIKTKSGKEGSIVKPYQKLTDNLISFYTEESTKQLLIINPIIKSSPKLLVLNFSDGINI